MEDKGIQASGIFFDWIPHNWAILMDKGYVGAERDALRVIILKKNFWVCFI